MINLLKTIIEALKSFFIWRSDSIKYNIYKDRKDKEKMRQRAKLRKQLREIAKNGDIKDFFKIIIICTLSIFISGCSSISIHPIYQWEKRYNNLSEMKIKIEKENYKDTVWLMTDETLLEIINKIDEKYNTK